MSNSTHPKLAARLVALALIAAIPLAALAAPAQQERYLKDRDLRKLSEALAEYRLAKANRKGVNEADAAVKAEMESLDNKLKKDRKAPIEDVLASPGDLGYAIWMANDFAKTRVKKGKIAQVEWTGGIFSEDDPLEYAIWTPSKYSVRSGAYPLVITLPDAGIDPKTHLIERWESREIKDNVILAAPKLAETSEERLTIPGIGRVFSLIGAVPETHAVDYDRIFLVGRGLGVETAVAIASYFPDRWAGVIGRAGDAGATPVINFFNLPTFFAGGGAQVSAFEKAAEDAGYDNCTVQAAALEPDIWNWIQAQRRDAYPSKIVFSPQTHFANRCYWLKVPGTEESSAVRIEASIDREANTVTVQGTGVLGVTLYFGDSLIDMEKPITVVANGQRSTDVFERSRSVVLDLFSKAAIDPGKIFTYMKTYPLPSLAPTDGESGKSGQ